MLIFGVYLLLVSW
ncbi:Putative uncharacterized protein [Lacticaseibacillus paracasei]|nr:Putative uncharacterized protein [Lacticaseibacillus paracasei]